MCFYFGVACWLSLNNSAAEKQVQYYSKISTKVVLHHLFLLNINSAGSLEPTQWKKINLEPEK